MGQFNGQSSQSRRQTNTHFTYGSRPTGSDTPVLPKPIAGGAPQPGEVAAPANGQTTMPEPTKTIAQLQAELDGLKAELALARSNGARGIKVAIGPAGGMSLYLGNQRQPLTMYLGGWDSLFENADKIKAAYLKLRPHLKQEKTESFILPTEFRQKDEHGQDVMSVVELADGSKVNRPKGKQFPI